MCKYWLDNIKILMDPLKKKNKFMSFKKNELRIYI